MAEAFSRGDGWALLCQALAHPERLGLEALASFLAPLAQGAAVLPAEEAAPFAEAAGGVLALMGRGLDAAPNLSVLEEMTVAGAGGDGSGCAKLLMQVLGYCRAALAALRGPADAQAAAAPVQREVVLRLLRSGVFARQLVGVRELYALLADAFEFTTSAPELLQVREGGWVGRLLAAAAACSAPGP